MKTKWLSRLAKYKILPLCKRPRIISRIAENGILITFDDGPYEGITAKILSILKEFNTKALFFHIGQQTEKLPNLTRLCLDEGHEVGVHSYAHKDPLLQTRDEFMFDYWKAHRILVGYFNLEDEAIYYRPPWGRLNVRLLSYYWQINRKIILWSRDFKDHLTSGNSEMIRKAFSQISLKERDILLFHEVPGIVKALPFILESIKESNMNILSASAAFADRKRT